MPATEVGDSPRIVAFDSVKHAGLGVSPVHLCAFTTRHNVILLNLAEFFYASQNYPVVFLKNEDNVMQVCAVTGLQQGENLFSDDRGNWQEYAYVPAYIRRFPFFTAAAKDKSDPDKRVIMVDETGLIPSTDPFFDTAGNATDKWDERKAFIADFISAEKQTAGFAARVDKLDLLEAFDAQINPQGQDSMRVSGMQRINENKLNRLPAKVIKELMRQGDLSRIYAHLISLENFAKLLDLSVVRKQSKAVKNQKS